ncbi:MAG: hypothetical protein GC188_07045 [Alphaproteobacteria bacterium]|nr:hypothetical protein [Alphaproteobacteria bacterium]
MIIVLVVALSSCSAFYSASVMEAEALFERHREAYQAIADTALAAPRREPYSRTHSIFRDIHPLPRFRYAQAWNPDGSRPSSTYINLYAYGLSISGRTVGLVFFREGVPGDFSTSEHVQIFDSCDDAEAAFETEGSRLRMAYCTLGDGWYATQVSN